MSQIDEARAAAKKKWGRLSPFRIGIQVGEQGLDVKNPYKRGGRGWKCFEEGVAYGADRRAAIAPPAGEDMG